MHSYKDKRELKETRKMENLRIHLSMTRCTYYIVYMCIILINIYILMYCVYNKFFDVVIRSLKTVYV